jgi:hypothetical protein
MFTSWDKAIAAIVTPLLSILVLAGFLPEDLATDGFIAGMTSALTGLVTWLVPNKES